MDDDDRTAIGDLAKEYARLRLDFDTYATGHSAEVNAWWKEQWKRNESIESRLDREMALMKHAIEEESGRCSEGLKLVQGSLRENGREIQHLRAQQMKLLGGIGALVILLQIFALIVSIR